MPRDVPARDMMVSDERPDARHITHRSSRFRQGSSDAQARDHPAGSRRARSCRDLERSGAMGRHRGRRRRGADRSAGVVRAVLSGLDLALAARSRQRPHGETARAAGRQRGKHRPRRPRPAVQRGARASGDDRLRHDRARRRFEPRHDLQHRRRHRRRWQRAQQAPQADADQSGTHGLGFRRRLDAQRRRHVLRPHRDDALLGELYAARALRAVRAGRRSLRRADLRQRRRVDRNDAAHRTRRLLLGRRQRNPAQRSRPAGRFSGPGDALSGCRRVDQRRRFGRRRARGKIVAGPLRREAGILYADIDLDAVAAARRRIDVAGHYARPDVFRLHVNRQRQSPVSFD